MEDMKTKAKTFKIRLLRNYFIAPGVKRMAGEIIELDKDEAQRLLATRAGEKLDARSID